MKDPDEVLRQPDGLEKMKSIIDNSMPLSDFMWYYNTKDMQHTPSGYSTTWKNIVSLCNKIPDPILRRSFIESYRLKAIDEWGFNPDGGIVTEKQKDPIEQIAEYLFECTVYEVKRADRFELDTLPDQEAQEYIEKEMREFIKSGSTYDELSDKLVGNFTRKLYDKIKFELLVEEGKQLDYLWEDFIKRNPQVEKDCVVSLGDAMKQAINESKQKQSVGGNYANKEDQRNQ